VDALSRRAGDVERGGAYLHKYLSEAIEGEGGSMYAKQDHSSSSLNNPPKKPPSIPSMSSTNLNSTLYPFLDEDHQESVVSDSGDGLMNQLIPNPILTVPVDTTLQSPRQPTSPIYSRRNTQMHALNPKFSFDGPRSAYGEILDG
jgi:hypothetical protein